MKTRVFNILMAMLGVAAAFGYKLDLSPEQLSTLTGLIVAIAASVNQLVHEVQRPTPPAAPKAPA